MKIKKRLAALLLSCCLLLSGILGSYRQVEAAEVVGSGAALQWLFGIFMGAGITVDVLDWFGGGHSADDWDWGDLLDQPASQKQIDDTEEMIQKMYNNATAEWYKNHGGQLPSPTPVPTSPPVTVPPVNPDDVEPPLDWDTLKKRTLNKGVLEMGAATYLCLKDAIDDFLIDVFYIDEGVSDVSNTYDYKNLIGYQTLKFHDISNKIMITRTALAYLKPGQKIDYFIGNPNIEDGFLYHKFYQNNYLSSDPDKIQTYFISDIVYDNGRRPYHSTYKFVGDSIYMYINTDIDSLSESYCFYIPYEIDGVRYSPQYKPPRKKDIWVNPDLVDNYNNNTSLNFPETAPPPIKVPALDEIKDLMNQGKNNEDDRPVIVENFITNHYMQPTPNPNPTDSPKPDPNPTEAPEPDPNPTEVPEPDPNPTDAPEPDPNPTDAPEPDPNPTEAPEPDPDPTGPPDKPGGTDVDVEDYKADLRLVFPFCIPFDLIALLNALDAEPEAPVFTFPFNLEFNDPFTGEKILDIHEEFSFDFSEFDSIVKGIRIFEVIGFMIGLMMITRTHMIRS